MSRIEVEDLTRIRAEDPRAIARAAAERLRPEGLLGEHGGLLMVACDHPARGALGAGARGNAMADRPELLRRLVHVLEDPAVNGILASPDVLDDLLLLDALHGKVVVGSMNRGGLLGSAWELDDRFTAYTPAAIHAAGFEGGKTLTRIDLSDPGTVATLEATGRAVTDLAERGLMAMLEPFVSARDASGKLANVLTADAVASSSAVCAGLGASSAHTWLKVPMVDDMATAMRATTLPAVVLGGEVSADAAATYERWRTALELPTVYGLALGRGLLFPADDDVDAALTAVTGLMDAVA